MKKLYEAIFGLISSLIIFSSPADSKKITNISNDYHVPDIPKISSLDQIELISKPSPLILKQADFDTDNMFAGHRSHSSHRSHASHASHASHSSGSTAPSKTPLEEEKPTSGEPRSPSETTTAPLEPAKSEKPSSGSTPSTTPPTSIKKEWRTTTEWLSQPCKLYHHEVFGILNNGGGFKGVVTECKDDSIQITDKTKEWIKLQNIKSLMWK